MNLAFEKQFYCRSRNNSSDIPEKKREKKKPKPGSNKAERKPKNRGGSNSQRGSVGGSRR